MGETEGDTKNAVEDPEPYFTPVVKLPIQEIPTMEEDETVCFKARAKLYRYDKDDDPPEWKERGVGEVKLLKHNSHGRVRVLMRRDKTLKLCANHFIQKYMTLDAQGSSDRVWIWRAIHDFADGEPKDETLAIRFKTSEIAEDFKQKFEDARNELTDTDLFEEKKKEESTQNGDNTTNIENQNDQITPKNSSEIKDPNSNTTNLNSEDTQTLTDGIEATGEQVESVVTDLKKLNVQESSEDKPNNEENASSKTETASS